MIFWLLSDSLILIEMFFAKRKCQIVENSSGEQVLKPLCADAEALAQALGVWGKIKAG
jgi:hypothetical protein